jgi:hypothetical protein
MMTDHDGRQLRECPFCGGARLENLDAADYGGPVMCIDCGARGPLVGRNCGVQADDGCQAWNVRAGEKERAFMAAAMGEGL